MSTWARYAGRRSKTFHHAARAADTGTGRLPLRRLR